MKLLKKILILLMAVMLIAGCFVGCSSKGKALLTLGDSEISVNMFQLFLSRQKGLLCSNYAYGSEALSSSFWDTIMDVSGTTYNDYYTNEILENSKIYLAALALFEEKGLKLPDSYIDDIDARLDSLIENDADGSKSKFNSILSAYGVNYKILREAYFVEAKISYLQDELFGQNGSKISPELLEDYFSKTYVRFKQVFLYTYKIIYETDENGDSIYYKEDGTVAYDTDGTPKKDDSGKYIKDKQGNTIYYNDDGSIAYDKTKGTRKTMVDSNGNVMVEDLSAEKINQLKQDAEAIMSEATEGDYVKFDALIEEHNLDSGMSKYPNGYYVTATTDYDSPEVIKALFEMKEGEVRLVQSEFGFHVVMKYELENKPYENKANADFFVDGETGEYLFMDNLIATLFADYLEKYTADIVVNKELLNGVDIKSIGANFYY